MPFANEYDFKLMTFNIEYGGTQVDFEKVIEAIRTVNPHLVAIEEAFGNIPRLAKELGWNYFDTRLQIVSQLPLLDAPEGKGIYIFVEIAKGRVVAVCNVHLPNDPEGNLAILNGATAQDIIALEKKARLPFVQKQLDVLTALAENGIPIFLAGDFNAPSHLDWTESMLGVRKQIRYALEWPVSKAVMDAGLRDSFRDIYPDAKKDPGITHWAVRPQVQGWNPQPDDPLERIDFIFAGGPSRTLESYVLGEENIAPWPSDHRALVSVFSVRPVPTPMMITTDRRLVSVGERIQVWYHGAGRGEERVVLVRAGNSQALLTQPVDQKNPTAGGLSILLKDLKKGAYELRLLDAKDSVLSAYPFWIKEKDDQIVLKLDKASYGLSDLIKVEWENAPGNRWDWVGIYKAGDDSFVNKPLAYAHTDASIVGFCVFNSLNKLTYGNYEMLYCIDDDYVCVARVPFEIK